MGGWWYTSKPEGPILVIPDSLRHEELLVFSDVPVTLESRGKSDDSKQFLFFVALIFLPILDSNLHYYYIEVSWNGGTSTPRSFILIWISGFPLFPIHFGYPHFKKPSHTIHSQQRSAKWAVSDRPWAMKSIGNSSGISNLSNKLL